ncbi:MAG: hypothetical protein HY072_07165 [Deltaproteobacteria bacterium]|nr:hypothetical protein [Deltaproteobacteria bacterium]
MATIVLSLLFLNTYGFAIDASKIHPSVHTSAVCELLLDKDNAFYKDFFRNFPEEQSHSFPFDMLKPEHFVNALAFAFAYVEHAVQTVVTNPAPPTFENTALLVMNAIAYYHRVSGLLHLIGKFQTNNAKIQELNKKKKTTDAKVHAMRFRNEQLFERLKQIAKNEYLTEDQKFIVNAWIEQSEFGKVLLNEDSQKELLTIDEQLANLSQEFRVNYDNTQNSIIFLPKDTKFEPEMPQAQLEAAKKRAGLRGFDGFDFELKPEGIEQMHVVLQFASDPQVRKTVYEAFIHRASVTNNPAIVTQMANLRLRRSRLLGFNNFTETIMPTLMAKNVNNVRDFVSQVKPEFIKMAREELRVLGELKKEMTGGALEPWDVQFYAQKKEARDLGFNLEQVAPYLEVNGTLKRVLDLVSSIYDVSFEEKTAAMPTWHRDVKVFSVLDKWSNRLMGYIYFDLLARDGKTNGAFSEEIKPPGHYISPEGKQYIQASHVIVSLSIRSGDQVSFLTLNNLRSLLHETGHAMHSVSYAKEFPLYDSFSVPRDFVELPSQLLENWMYDSRGFARLARHYQTGEQIPEGWLGNIGKIKFRHPALKSLARRCLMTEMDLAYHTIEVPITDSQQFDQDSLKDWAQFPYLMGIAGRSDVNPYLWMHGYESQYHAYQWGENLDYDAFEKFLPNDLFNATVGLDFREMVLAHGALVDLARAYKQFRRAAPDPHALVREYKR